MADATISAPLFDVPETTTTPFDTAPMIKYSAVEQLAQAILEGRVKVNLSYGWTGETRSITSYKIVVYPQDDE